VKQKDIALIVVIVVFSAIVSLFASKALFSSPKDRQQQVEVVEAIDPNFPTPDKTYFNAQAVDPAQNIQIGDNNNTNPFNSSSQQ
jgi:hypothetical protein